MLTVVLMTKDPREFAASSNGVHSGNAVEVLRMTGQPEESLLTMPQHFQQGADARAPAAAEPQNQQQPWKLVAALQDAAPARASVTPV